MGVVAGEIGVIFGGEGIDGFARCRFELVEPAEFRHRHDQWVILGPYRVIRRRDPGLAVAAKLGAIDVIEHRRVRAELENETLERARPARIGDRAGTAEDRRHLGRPGHHGRKANAGKHSGTAANEPFLGERDRSDHALIRLPCGLAKGEDTVLQEHESLNRRVTLEDLGRFLGELEARHDVGHEPHPPPIEIGTALGGVRLVGNAQDGRRMRVVYIFVRQEGMQ